MMKDSEGRDSLAVVMYAELALENRAVVLFLKRIA